MYVSARARVITGNFCSLQIDEKESKRVGKGDAVGFTMMLLNTATPLKTSFLVFFFFFCSL